MDRARTTRQSRPSETSTITLTNLRADEYSGGHGGNGDGQMQPQRGDQSDIAPQLNEAHAYPEADRGLAAWMMLAGCSLIQLPIWGYSQAFGILQDYYMTQDPTLQGDKSSVPVIGATNTGVLYLLSPISFALLTKYPRLRPHCGIVGLVLAVAGFAASAFASQVWHLVLTQGVLASVGCGLLFTPTTLYLNEWFVRRKGLALGIMWAGKSAVGVALPFLAQFGVQRYGARTLLLAWSVIVAISTLPTLKFIKPRIPLAPPARSRSPDEHGPGPKLFSRRFLEMPSFWTLQLSNMLQGLGYFVPSMYIFSYATSTLGFPAFAGTLMIAAINTSSVLGGIVLGMLCDRYPINNVLLLSSVGSALSVFCFWGLSSPLDDSAATEAASPYAVLTAFAIAYGFFAGGWSSTWSGIMTHLKREAPGLESGLMFGLLAGGRGVGNVISGPVAAALLSHGGVSSAGGLSWVPGYDTQYGSVILFTGTTALLGGCSWFWQLSKACTYV